MTTNKQTNNMDGNNVQMAFIHIPKCAGTSIISTFRDNFGEDEIYWYGVSEPYYKYNGSLKNISKKRFVGGHFTLDQIDSIPVKKAIFTVIRNPIDRIISLYRFIERTPAHSLYPLSLSGNINCFLDNCINVVNGKPAIKKVRVNSHEVTNGMCKRFSASGTAEDAFKEIGNKNIRVLFQETLKDEWPYFLESIGLGNTKLNQKK